MSKVMIFGAFDILHPGHQFFIKQARGQGDFLVAVVGRDMTIKNLKGEFPSENEQTRLNKVKVYCNKAVLGDRQDFYKVIKDEKPDIICIGYDQINFLEGLRDKLNEFGLRTKIMRIGAYNEKEFKSSLIKKKTRGDSGRGLTRY